jgi:hypothetical protein
MFHVSKKRIVPDAKQTVGKKQKEKVFFMGCIFILLPGVQQNNLKQKRPREG